MKRRKWTAQQKAAIVLEGMRGRAVSEICLEHQLTQSQYYKWRDQVMENLPKLFELNHNSKQEDRLKRENAQLKACVAELTLEVKKSEW